MRRGVTTSGFSRREMTNHLTHCDGLIEAKTESVNSGKGRVNRLPAEIEHAHVFIQWMKDQWNYWYSLFCIIDSFCMRKSKPSGYCQAQYAECFRIRLLCFEWTLRSDGFLKRPERNTKTESPQDVGPAQLVDFFSFREYA